MINTKKNDLPEKYYIALGILQAQFDILSEEYKKLGKDNPIEHFSSRLKEVDSIKEKLRMKAVKKSNSNYEFTVENIDDKLSDVVGIRIICPFLSDVYKMVEIIQSCFNIKVYKKLDYIKEPKENGYSSYHMKIDVPIQNPFTGIEEIVKAEIQVRTCAQDVTASLEHKIYYKKNIELPERMKENIQNTIKYCNELDKDLNQVLLSKRSKKKQPKFRMFQPALLKNEEFNQYIQEHNESLNIMKSKINQIHQEYDRENNPIEHVKYRLKTPERIIEKLERQNKKLTLENVKTYVNDIAGIRIVCSFLDDVEEIITRIKEDPTLKVIEDQDYMSQPKDNGYSSYHMQVLVPVSTPNGIVEQKVEIQVRTIVQEMWAILQERLCYQEEVEDEVLNKDLKRIAGTLKDIDYNMNEMIKYSRKLQEENQKTIKKKVLN